MAQKNARPKLTPIERMRAACAAMPGCEEKLSHGSPTFFVRKRVFAMFVDNHHGDGHVAAWLPAAPGVQEEMIAEAPEKYFRPPYVGCRGWVGVELARVHDEELRDLVSMAWRRIAPKTMAGA